MKRTALVAGGTHGLGRIISVALQEHGHTVVAVASQDSEAVAGFRRSTGIPVRFWDAADIGACREGVAQSEREFGPLGILVNHPIVEPQWSATMTSDQWSRGVAFDLLSSFNMCCTLIHGMVAHGFGRIVNVSPLRGGRGQCGQTDSLNSAAGLLAFTSPFQCVGLGRNVTVNAIGPGCAGTGVAAIKTLPQAIRLSIVGAIPHVRLGSSLDVARAIIFLTDEEAGGVSNVLRPAQTELTT